MDEVEGDALVEGMQRMEVGETGEGTEQAGSEGEDTMDTGKGNESEEAVDVGRVEGNVVVEGETPSEYLEGEIPVVGSSEGETPSKDLEGETPVVKNVEGETPAVGVVEGETPDVGFTKGKDLADSEEYIPCDNVEEVADGYDIDNEEEEPVKEIVYLVGESAEEVMSVDERTSRRTTRRIKMLEELEETPRSRMLRFEASPGEGQAEDGDSKAEEELEADEDLSQAEERRLVAERKRKGKLEAKALTKKRRADSSTLEIEEPTPEAIRALCQGIRGTWCRKRS